MIGDSLENDSCREPNLQDQKTVWMNHPQIFSSGRNGRAGHVALAGRKELKELIGRIIETVERTSGEENKDDIGKR